MPETMTPLPIDAQMEQMLSRDGLYVIANPLYEGWTGVCVVIGAKPGLPGRLFALNVGEELSTDAEAWAAKGTHVAGGPFSVQTCAEQERIDEAAELNNELISDELSFWRGQMTQARPMLENYERIMREQGKTMDADCAKSLIDNTKELEPDSP